MSDSDDNRITLRDHFLEQIKWVDRYFEKQLESSHTAIEKAEQQLSKRLEGMNEFRDTLKDQAARLATKDEMFSLVGGVEKRIQVIERQMSANEGKASVTTILWALAASVGVGLLFFFIKK